MAASSDSIVQCPWVRIYHEGVKGGGSCFVKNNSQLPLHRARDTGYELHCNHLVPRNIRLFIDEIMNLSTLEAILVHELELKNAFYAVATKIDIGVHMSYCRDFGFNWQTLDR